MVRSSQHVKPPVELRDILAKISRLGVNNILFEGSWTRLWPAGPAKQVDPNHLTCPMTSRTEAFQAGDRRCYTGIGVQFDVAVFWIIFGAMQVL